MLDADSRPLGRLFCLCAMVAVLVMSGGLRVAAAPQNGPAMTTVQDSVYNADGSFAQGSLVITWPAFVTASGTAIAGGSTSVTLGADGALSVQLVPDVGANPAGVYYSVVYQLGPSNVRTEYWLVPASSPANLATVRTTPGEGLAGQPVSMQYVNSALATKADDSSVVHLSGPETISGSKTFATAPSVPAPQKSGDVANKAYVDSGLANVGAGNYLPTTGGTMSGPITLSGPPSAPLQAASKAYVDAGTASKADLVNGLVPSTELGTGTANAGSCLLGNGTWGACGSGGGNVSTTPAATQAIAEPAGAVFTANRVGQKRMADQFNWKQNPASPLSIAPGTVTVTLSPCPQGFLNTINGSNSNHWIYLDSAAGDTQQPGEPVLITAENCPAGASSGTITFSAAYAHATGYALESGTGGIKEASIDANQVRYDTVRGNDTWIEVTPNATTKIKAPLYWQTSMGRLDGGASLLECAVNMSCVNIGDTNSGGFAKGNSNTYVDNVVSGLWIRPDQSMSFWDVAPSSPAAITAGSTSATLTIATCPAGFWPLIPNQILWLNGTSGGLVSTAYEAGAPGPGEFVRVTGGTCTPGMANGTIAIVPATPGISALYAHDAGYTLSNGATALIEDNSQGTILENLQVNGWVGNVGYGFLIQNDNNQGEEVRNVNVNGGLRCDADFCGATLFGPGPNSINAGITHMYGGTNATCAEWYDGNDFLLGPTVCEGFQNFAVFLSTKRGGALEGAEIHSVHRERGGVSNSLGQNLGAADLVVQGYNVTVDGSGGGMNQFPAFSVAGNPGGQLQNYYLSIMDVTDATKTVPIPIGQANVSNPATNNVTVKWVTADVLAGKTINFELYRLTPSAGVAGQVPYAGVCDGLNGDGTCLVATNISPATVCDIHGACTFNDNIATPAALTPFTGSDGTGGGGYFPYYSFSPGGIVLSAGATYQGTPACIVSAGAPWLTTTASVSTNGYAPTSNCIPGGGSYNPILSAFPNNGGTYSQWGMLLPDRNRTNDAGHWTGIKGRVNFLGGGTYPRDVMTWFDSNPAKTMSSKQEFGSGVAGTSFGTVNRPQWDAGDIATGVENGGTGFYERVPSNGAFDWYVGALPNNSGGISNNWSEELSSSGHIFKVPVTINGNLTVTGSCTGCGSGSGSSSWSGLTSPTANLNVSLGTYLTGLNIGDFGATPSTGVFSVTDSATSTSDTSTNFLLNTGASSRHNSFTAQLNGINQFQICWQPGPQGETVVGSAVPCSGISQSPFAKFVVMSQTGSHSVQRLYQGSTSASGTMAEWNNATAAGTGFNFWKACAGATGSDSGCGSGTIVASLRGDGFLIASGGSFTGAVSGPTPAMGDNGTNLATTAFVKSQGYINGTSPTFTGTVTLPITGTGSQCLHVSATGVVSGTGSDCGTGSGGGSGTINSGTASQLAMYSASGTAVTGDSALTDNGLTLSYSGTGGVSASSFQSTGSGAFLETTEDQAAVPAALPPTGSTTQYSYNGELCAVSPAGQVSCTEVDSSVVHTSGNETIAGNKTLTGALNGVSANFSGNLTVGGQIIGTGPWQVSGPVPGLAVTPVAGQSQAAFDTNGNLVVSENGGPALTVAKLNGSLASKTIVGTDASGHLVDASSATLANNITGTAANLSGTPALPNGTTAGTQAAGDNSAKIATTAYVRSEGQFTWTCPVAGSTAISSNCNWTLPANITVTQLDFAANTAAAGCTTYPTFQVWDGTAGAEVGSFSVALTSGTNFMPVVGGSANVAATHQLRIKVTTAAAGCSTYAGGMVATVTYQMQN